MVTLNEETSGAAVCTILETLIRTGVKLGVFDLLTARFWAQDLNLRQNWEAAQTEDPIIEDFQIDPYYVLQIIGLLEPGADKDGNPRAPSIKRSMILEMGVQQARKGRDRAVEGLADILTILRDECGVLVTGLIPYTTILIPMAATWVSQRDAKGADAGANRIKLLTWCWCSVFGQRYENAPNSQAEKDFGELRAWMQGGPEPESVGTFTLESLRLRNTRPKQRAVYRGTMALILQNGALDFYKRGPITPQVRETLERQRTAFREKFGRDPGPEDPVFFDPEATDLQPLNLERLEAEFTEAMVKADIDPAIIHACRRTGLIVTTDNQHLLSEADLEEWNAALAEYEENMKRRPS